MQEIVGETGSYSGGKTMINKSLIQFYADEWGCVPSLQLGLRQNYGRGNGDLLH